MSAGNSGAGGVTGDRRPCPRRRRRRPARSPARKRGARRAGRRACRAMNTLGINQGTSGNVVVALGPGCRRGLPGDARPRSAYDRMGSTTSSGCRSISLPRAGRAGARVDGAARAVHRMANASRSATRPAPRRGGRPHAFGPFATTLACCPAIQSDGIPAFHYMVAVAGGDDIRCARYATFGIAALSRNRAGGARRAARLPARQPRHAACRHARLDAALALAVEVESAGAHVRAGPCARRARGCWIAREMARVLERFSTYGVD